MSQHDDEALVKTVRDQQHTGNKKGAARRDDLAGTRAGAENVEPAPAKQRDRPNPR